MRIVAHLLFLLFMVATYAAIGPAVGGGLASYAVVLLLSFISTLVHELAHATVAQIYGARVVEIMVLPFRYRPAKRRLEMAGRMDSGEVGGFVRYTLDRIGARRKHAVIAVAGPAANLALSAILFGMCALLPALTTPLPFLRGLAILSLGAGVVNLLPFDGSDGGVILRALRNRRARSDLDA